MSVDFGCSLWPQTLTFHLGTVGQRLPKEKGVSQQPVAIPVVQSMFPLQVPAL